jgi:hypothetical protein
VTVLEHLKGVAADQTKNRGAEFLNAIATMPLKSNNPMNKNPHPQYGPIFTVDHDGDLPSKENTDEWCKHALSEQLIFVHTTATALDKILDLAKCFYGWENVFLYSLTPAIIYDIDRDHHTALEYGHLSKPTFLDAATIAMLATGLGGQPPIATNWHNEDHTYQDFTDVYWADVWEIQANRGDLERKRHGPP